MAETPLSAALADALPGTTDADTDLVYMAIGESTYYTTDARMIQRTLRMAKNPAGNELRVGQDGSLTVEVRPGFVQLGPTGYDHAGVTGEVVADNDTSYIFLTPADVLAGNSVTVNTTGFPATPHIPLATVATGSESTAAVGGTYDYRDITDYRGRAQWVMPGMGAGIVEENTAGVGSPNILIASESGLILSNEGSAATNHHTLPTAAPGLTYTAIRADATDDIRILAAAGDKIIVVITPTKAAGYIESTARWDRLTLVAVDDEFWVAMNVFGTWTVEVA